MPPALRKPLYMSLDPVACRQFLVLVRTRVKEELLTLTLVSAQKIKCVSGTNVYSVKSNGQQSLATCGLRPQMYEEEELEALGM
jgi:hypothetical protein